MGGHRSRAARRAAAGSFAYADYGFPDAYGVVLIANSPWLSAHPERAAAFVQAAQRGYQLAADDPERAAQGPEEANPGAFTEPELVVAQPAMLSERYLRDDAGVVGTQTLERWSGFSGFLFDAGVLAGPDGPR